MAVLEANYLRWILKTNGLVPGCFSPLGQRHFTPRSRELRAPRYVCERSAMTFRSCGALHISISGGIARLLKSRRVRMHQFLDVSANPDRPNMPLVANWRAYRQLVNLNSSSTILLVVDSKHRNIERLLITYPLSTKWSEQTVVPFHKKNF